ncbi:hypothetical protein EMEDMD4_1310091 [Sinorhizobium medicae]|uniref:Uncharacterized protein n=1 Tax=Sinorhizobium medicae TaxID=110321 RepID=A0A508WTH2_9HYPH|nr:hypothetical protein EMEDMD4_1310091 [Sinorhizobium medicae]
MDEAENAFRDMQPRGLLRVDAHPLLTRTFLLPRLTEFLDRLSSASTFRSVRAITWWISSGRASIASSAP